MNAQQSHGPNAELTLKDQVYGSDPLQDRGTDHYRKEYIRAFVDKWDELINWSGRAEGEGAFFIDLLQSRGKRTVLDVACGTGFHSVRLIEAGFDVYSTDGSATMLARAFANAQRRGLILKMTQTDWRWLNRDVNGKYDAIICLGDSFTHLHEETDRRRALAEFYAALKHDGMLILDQRNYDAILDHGFHDRHRYYYVGEQVSAEPEHVDEGLVRMKYRFPDGAEFTLNTSPIRKNYVRRLLTEAAFQRVRTYGDFQATYAEEPDFFIHVAEKSALPLARPGAPRVAGRPQVHDIAEDYYDSDDADTFYSLIWGGEDLHIGVYDEGVEDIRAASDATVARMLDKLPSLGLDATVLDMGSGYGGSMRQLVRRFGCRAVCLNISATQNDYNRQKIRRAGLGKRIQVHHGVFEAVPLDDASIDVVWSQDAFLHSDQRERALAEAWRVLRPGGMLIFTDPCQADHVPEGVLQPVYERLHLSNLGSFGFYRRVAEELGFDTLAQEDLTPHLRSHYARVRAALLENHQRLREAGASAAYLERMTVGLENWVKAADAGHLTWGIQVFGKPA